MKIRIINYLNTIEDLINKYKKIVDGTSTQEDDDEEVLLDVRELTEEIENHLIQISFFQHERLIHLIVTLLFAILTVGSIFFTIATGTASILILTVFLLVLLVPYVKHYYLLENGVQKMYKQYDKLIEIKKSCYKLK